MTSRLILPPTEEPITVVEARDHLRLETTDDDTIVGSLITVARQKCETFQRRAYCTQTWELWLDAFPSGDTIELTHSPVQSVTDIKYYDTDDAETVLPGTDYFVDAVGQPGRVILRNGKSWPDTTLRNASGVCITYVAGYGAAADVPEAVKHAIKLLVGHLYENREAVVVGSGLTVTTVPDTVEALLSLDRVLTFPE